MSASDRDELLTLAEAARELGRSESHVQYLITHGALPATRLPSGTRPYRLARSDVERYRQAPRGRTSRRRIADDALRTAIGGSDSNGAKTNAKQPRFPVTSAIQCRLGAAAE